MIILALDTTTDISSIAVADDKKILGECNLRQRMDLSRRLVPRIVSLLGECGKELKDVGAIGVSLGPGSFTGLRIGVVTANTLSQTMGVPIVGVVSLDLLAQQFDYLPHGLVCPITKVRKGEVYYAFYRANDGLERVSEYAAESIEDLAANARELEGGKIIFCGDALADNLAALNEALPGRVIPSPEWLCFSKASILARLTFKKISLGGGGTLPLTPYYIRKSTPEMRLECKADV